MASNSVTVRVAHGRSVTVSPGISVIVEWDGGCFGAVVSSVAGIAARLTFTPKGAPRVVPVGAIIAASPVRDAIMALSQVPRYQPEPKLPLRRRRHD